MTRRNINNIVCEKVIMISLKKISGVIIKSFVNQGIINDEEKDIYQFGLNQLMFFIVNMISSIAIGLIAEMLAECIVFTLAYMLLRRYSGGYHARTSVRCYFLSVCLMIVVLKIINITISNEYYHIVFVVLLLSGLVIILKAPIESENKPLNDAEYEKYRKKSLVIMAVEIIVAICSFFFNKTISVCTAFAVIIAACMLLVSLGTDIIKRKRGLISSQ